jgi:hypothetical protein
MNAINYDEMERKFRGVYEGMSIFNLISANQNNPESAEIFPRQEMQ